MHIEITSTLTHEDENRLAPAVMKLLSGMLDMLPVAYVVRVETADQQVMEHLNPSPMPELGPLVSPPAEAARRIVES